MTGSIIVINVDIRETRVALVEGGVIAELQIERASHRGTVGNVVLGKVTRVLPGMQAAFIDVGQERSAFLHVEDLIRPDDFELYLAGGNEEQSESFRGTGERKATQLREEEDDEEDEEGAPAAATVLNGVGAGSATSGAVKADAGEPSEPSTRDPVIEDDASEEDASEEDASEEDASEEDASEYDAAEGASEDEDEDVPEDEDEDEASEMDALDIDDLDDLEDLDVEDSAEDAELDAAEDEDDADDAELGEDEIVGAELGDLELSDSDLPDSEAPQAVISDADADAEADSEERDLHSHAGEAGLEAAEALDEDDDDVADDVLLAAAAGYGAGTAAPSDLDAGHRERTKSRGSVTGPEGAEDRGGRPGRPNRGPRGPRSPHAAAVVSSGRAEAPSRQRSNDNVRSERGRSEGVRVDAPRAEGARPEAARADGGRTDTDAGRGRGRQRGRGGPQGSRGRRGRQQPQQQQRVEAPDNSKLVRGRRAVRGKGSPSGGRSEATVPARVTRSVPITEVVSEGDQVVVQISKEPIGTKGARVTSHVSLPGRYVVYLPTVDHLGISKRIGSARERQRLRQVMESLKPARGGLIVRTVAEGLTKKQLKADVGYLIRVWAEVCKRRETAKPAEVLYTELDLVLKVARDLFTDEVKSIVIDDREQYNRLVRFVEMFLPERVKDIELYTGSEPIFDAYGIEDEIGRALSRKVPLPSGGSLIVDQAEALTAIDVNTGRYVGKGSKDLEETALKTNLEAVEEIAYQLRFRNIGGLVILDLIDMEKFANREKVWRALETALVKDKAKTTLNRISELGLIEMTRKRTRESLGRMLHEPCFYCDGTGQIQSKATIAYEILRQIGRERYSLPGYSVVVNAHPAIVDFLKTVDRSALDEAERRYARRIELAQRTEYHIEQYDLQGK